MKAITAITLVAFTAFAGTAYAADPPLFYAGASFGAASSNTYVQTTNWTQLVDKSTLGWSLFAGIRPLSYLGAELNYIDFGNSKVNNIRDGIGDITYQASAKNTAIAGYVVGYLPLVPSRFDLFAKAGYAHLSTKTDSNGNYPHEVTCDVSGSSCQVVGMATLSTSNQRNEFAYGFGGQYLFGLLGVRMEYQKISGTQAKPNMFSVGVTWSFH
jgi:Outer membrane protein beta-barrel domain